MSWNSSSFVTQAVSQTPRRPARSLRSILSQEQNLRALGHRRYVNWISPQAGPLTPRERRANLAFRLFTLGTASICQFPAVASVSYVTSADVSAQVFACSTYVMFVGSAVMTCSGFVAISTLFMRKSREEEAASHGSRNNGSMKR